MRRFILFLSCFLLLAIRIQAASYTPESLPMVYLQDQTSPKLIAAYHVLHRL